MTEDGYLDEKDLAAMTGMYARMRRMEAQFKQWRRMPDYQEAAQLRHRLHAEFGVVVVPGDGWDGPPVAL